MAPLKRKATPRIELMGTVTMSRLVDEIVETLEYQFEFKRFGLIMKWLTIGFCLNLIITDHLSLREFKNFMILIKK